MSIRVLLADDQTLVRTGFRLILDAEPDLEVVGEAEDGETAVAMARRLKPDVTIMDIRMPRLDGIEATRLLTGPDVVDPSRVVVVTTYDVDENVYAGLIAGACGFLLKDAGADLLVGAVRAAADGESMVSPSVTTKLLSHFTKRSARRTARRDVPLTDRELDVVLAVARGRTNVEIAADLDLALSTVKSHLTSSVSRLSVRNRTEVAIWAWQNGLVT